MDAGETKSRLDGGPPYENASSDQIKADIDQTRERMDHTLSEISQRLNPRHLFDEIVEYFRSDGNNTQRAKEAAARAGRTLVDKIQQHPLPSLLIGGGIVWLAIEQRRKAHESSYADYSDSDFEEMSEESVPIYGESGVIIETIGCDDDMESSSPGLKERAMEKGKEMKDHLVAGAEAAKAKASQAAGSVAQAARRLKSRAQTKASQWRENSRRMSRDIRHKATDAYNSTENHFADATENYPLAVGLGFMTIGVLTGLLIPTTRKEEEVMGETADQFVEQAKMKGKDLLEKGQRAASAAVHAATEKAKAQGLTPEAIKEKVLHVASDVKDAALESARKEGLDRETLKGKASQVMEEAKTAVKDEVKPGQSTKSSSINVNTPGGTKPATPSTTSTGNFSTQSGSPGTRPNSGGTC